MLLAVDENTHLELMRDRHAEALFKLIDNNRIYLKQWLNFIDRMQVQTDIENFIKGSKLRNDGGLEYAFMIYKNQLPIGRIGLYKIDLQNKIAEIGYWIIEQEQGKGTITKACKTLIKLAFETLNINRIEIKCATANHKSQAVPERLNFKKEAILKEAEFLNNIFIDLNLFALLKSEFHSN